MVKRVTKSHSFCYIYIMKDLEIYTLAEWDTFWAVIHNFLGWAHKCTYGFILEPRKTNPDEMRKELLQKVVEKGGRLHIHHLFEPFVNSEYPQYQRKFYDNGLNLIRDILKTDGLEVEWDIPDEEKETLLNYSPPLYHKLFKQ